MSFGCPRCPEAKLKCLETRSLDAHIYRRYRCPSCGLVARTKEVAVSVEEPGASRPGRPVVERPAAQQVAQAAQPPAQQPAASKPAKKTVERRPAEKPLRRDRRSNFEDFEDFSNDKDYDDFLDRFSSRTGGWQVADLY